MDLPLDARKQACEGFLAEAGLALQLEEEGEEPGKERWEEAAGGASLFSEPPASGATEGAAHSVAGNHW